MKYRAASIAVASAAGVNLLAAEPAKLFLFSLTI